ncbi:tyrosine-type recombinase/integrase [Nonomuraea sp. NPDC049504]|uniref:tyrosine-type recombinase/integrase n=1 Tax=Nonomuraea sp. NPDC049504 TaxID=3154729 RepID=UPI0034386C61
MIICSLVHDNFAYRELEIKIIPRERLLVSDNLPGRLHSADAISLDDAELYARLAALDEAAEQIDTRTANTKRNYAGDWRTWQTYTAQTGIPPMAATPGSLTGFVLWLAQRGDAPATIQRRLYGATVMLREQGVTVPDEAPRKARDVLNALARNLAEQGEKRGRGQAPAVTVQQLRKMSAALPHTLKGLRDRAILTVGFGMAARRSELAGLLVRDVVLLDEGLKVHVRYGKTGGRAPAIKRGTHPLTCPVTAWQAWVEAVELEAASPAFRRIDRHGNVLGKMSPQAVGNVVTDAAELASLDGITAHSLRSGLATEARRAGHDAKTIAEQGGWSPTSGVLYGYMRTVDEWADNATAGLGL